MALTGGATTAACILVLLALAGAAGATFSGSAPPPVDCSALLAGLADCLDFVSPGSKSSQPSKTCCGEVKTSVGSPAVVDCVCAAMFSKLTQLPINRTRVYALPDACGTPASVFNRCHGEHRAFSHFFHNLLALTLARICFPFLHQETRAKSCCFTRKFIVDLIPVWDLR
ncbi:unnamed protein product [Triticum turgidum subsp. durum]|uniref:Bifunctional inhibitor/plant lipid transfer protein/seed storage helical domain-containing protein n=1 Tax=Triticum turgidum subsp. durum TaxID=4567 RepID=A0A9R1B321_TRITD|nr:unnamed protein product [Triticum turgidum subsp. durum]